MFYAQSTPYGARTASGADRLHRFNSRAERDEWVKAAWTNCDHAGDERRTEVTRDEARRWYPDAFRADAHAFPRANRNGDYWDDPDAEGAQEWLGGPTGGVYADI